MDAPTEESEAPATEKDDEITPTADPEAAADGSDEPVNETLEPSISSSSRPPLPHIGGTSRPGSSRLHASPGPTSRQSSARSRGSTPPTPSVYGRNRPHRPLSADVAAVIEGYDDDFKVVTTEIQEENAESAAEGSGAEDDEGPDMFELIEDAKQEHHRLQEASEQLQKKVRTALEMRSKGRQAAVRDMSKLDGAHARYQSALSAWGQMVEEKERLEAGYQAQLFEMKAMLAERIQRADDISRAYHHFKMEVAKSAEHSKTGKPISQKLLAQLLQEERIREEEVQRVRLKNIHLNNQLHKLETKIRAKEELAEGLHLIDFEQLKIENQSLNEKIEERNEELLKLRKKTTATVQILTHIKEKLQFVEKENSSLAQDLAGIESQLAARREELQVTKTQRDKLREQSRKIKDRSVFVTQNVLLQDMETQKELLERLKEDVGTAKVKYTALTDKISSTNTKIMGISRQFSAVPASGRA